MFRRLTVILAVIGLFFSLKSQAYFDLPTGTLIKGSGPEVYVLEYGTKRWIPNPAVFSYFRYDWNNIIQVSDEDLKSFPKGGNMGDVLANGTLAKTDKNPDVYMYDAPQFRRVPNPDVFNSNNFVWRNIIIVPNEWMVRWVAIAGPDVKSGEFLLTPTTFIIAKPSAEINISEATFVYSGTNPTGPISELTWETYLDGFDLFWVPMSTNYTRVIDLPEINKTYTFFVRSRNKDGRIDPRPASYSFKVVGYSSFFSSDINLKISNYRINSSTAADGFLTINNNSSKSVNVTGMIIENKFKETFLIPQGVQYLFMGGADHLSDIVLEPNKRITLFSGGSPIGKNFLLNKCTGYLNYYYNFSPRLPEECPKPISQDIVSLSGNCRDYINAIPGCSPPNTADLKVTYDGQCTSYLLNTFNYSNCAINYRTYPDFLKNDWYIYINRGSGFMGNSKDEIKLIDRDGGLIDKISF